MDNLQLAKTILDEFQIRSLLMDKHLSGDDLSIKEVKAALDEYMEIFAKVLESIPSCEGRG